LQGIEGGLDVTQAGLRDRDFCKNQGFVVAIGHHRRRLPRCGKVLRLCLLSADVQEEPRLAVIDRSSSIPSDLTEDVADGTEQDWLLDSRQVLPHRGEGQEACHAHSDERECGMRRAHDHIRSRP